MEERKKDLTGEFAFSSLKIRTMQDDLKKHVPQADLPIAAVPPPAKAATVSKPAPPSQPPKPAAVPPASAKAIPEPPPYLPTEPVPSPPETIEPPSAPTIPIKEPAPSESFTPPSVLKLQSDLIYKETPKSIEPVPPSKRMKFGLLFGVPAAIIILGIFGFIYFRFLVSPPPLCPEGQITEECRCGEQSEETRTTGFCCDNVWTDFDCALTKPPEPIIPSLDEILTIDAAGSTLTEVISDIENSDLDISDEGAKIIAFRLASSPSRYATLDDLIDIFGIVLPDDVKTNNQAFNLLLYVNPSPGYIFSTTTPELSSATSTPETLATSTPEYRLVLVLSQKNKSNLEETMLDWETTMLEDMKPIILGQPAKSASTEFISTVYHNGFFRYKNLSQKNTTINYSIYQNLLILGTSKNSIFYVYDALDFNNSGTANP